MHTAEIFPKIIQKFPQVSVVPPKEKFVRDPDPQILVPPSQLLNVCRFIKEDPDLSFDLPNHMTAVDFIKDNIFELVYFLYSTKHKRGIVLKSQISRNEAKIDSVSPVWQGMDWQEREVFDLMGIEFTHHPNLKRIMLWDGFPGHPLRKDYVHITDKYDSGLEVGTPGFDEKGLPTQKN